MRHVEALGRFSVRLFHRHHFPSRNGVMKGCAALSPSNHTALCVRAEIEECSVFGPCVSPFWVPHRRAGIAPYFRPLMRLPTGISSPTGSAGAAVPPDLPFECTAFSSLG